jgi:hypothetical protein
MLTPLNSSVDLLLHATTKEFWKITRRCFTARDHRRPCMAQSAALFNGEPRCSRRANHIASHAGVCGIPRPTRDYGIGPGRYQPVYTRDGTTPVIGSEIQLSEKSELALAMAGIEGC